MPNRLTDISEEVLGSLILIVDDSEVNRMFLEKALEKRGFNNLAHAEDGRHALEMFSASKPDLVLLDLIMPKMDGFECCKKIRTLPEGEDVPILVQTALTKEEDRVKAFACGATDFVTKPLFPDELYARVKVHLENRHSLRNLKIYKERIEAEVGAARELQHSILPQDPHIRAIEEECGLKIASYVEPSSKIGGDSWGIKKLSADQIAFWVVDFSGHSVAAALNVFRLQTYIQDDLTLAARPGEYLSIINDKLLAVLERGHFATMFYAVLDIKTNRLLYASAGSPHPILLHRNNEKSAILDATGQPLGISRHHYSTQSVELLPDDTIFFYSNALIDTPNDRGKCVDERSLLSWLREITGTPQDAVKEILLRFNRHTSSNLRDDLTLCMIQRTKKQQKRIRAHA